MFFQDAFSVWNIWEIKNFKDLGRLQFKYITIWKINIYGLHNYLGTQIGAKNDDS